MLNWRRWILSRNISQWRWFLQGKVSRLPLLIFQYTIFSTYFILPTRRSWGRRWRQGQSIHYRSWFDNNTLGFDNGNKNNVVVGFVLLWSRFAILQIMHRLWAVTWAGPISVERSPRQPISAQCACEERVNRESQLGCNQTPDMDFDRILNAILEHDPKHARQIIRGK